VKEKMNWANKKLDRVVNTYLHPYKENVVRFDFEVAAADDGMYLFSPLPSWGQ
jgi:hypothetical protein